MADLNLNNPDNLEKGTWRRETIYLYRGYTFKRCRLVGNLASGFQWYLVYFDVQGTKRIPAPERLCSVFLNLQDGKTYISGLEKYKNERGNL